MKEFYKISRDAMFKSIFCKEENWNILERLIEEVINEKVKIINLSVPELPKDRITMKGKTLDVLVKTAKGEVNIEINSETTDYLKRRNASYIFKRYSNSTKVSEAYQKMPNFIQINLSSKTTFDYPRIATYTLYDKENKITFIDNLKIYEINLAKYKDFCYNRGIENSIIAMIDMTYEELLKVKGDKLMEKLKDEAIELNNDDDFVKLMSDEEEERLLKNSYIQEGIEQGIEKGIEQGIEKGIKEGIEQQTIELTKNMLKKNIDINQISEITGLSIDKITKLAKNVK